MSYSLLHLCRRLRHLHAKTHHQRPREAVFKHGICDALHHINGGLTGEQVTVMRHLFLQWPESSGCSAYPVPAPELGRGQGPEERRYRACLAYTSLDRWTGEYGAARLRLLDYMIEHLEDYNG